MKKLYSTLIISASITFSNLSVANETHYMSHTGDGPQGHMMNGQHQKAADGSAHKTFNDAIPKRQENKHYMQHSGDGPQGHTMNGKAHPESASADHTENFGKKTKKEKNGTHYMMMSGDGPQGYMMLGNEHSSK